MQHDRLDKFNRSVFDEWTPIQRLRLGELRRICKAYEIPFKATDKQRDLMPIVKRANDESIFAFGPSLIANAKHPHFLTGEAAPTPDLKVVDNGENESGLVDIAETSGEPCESIHLGMKLKWCVMQGDIILHKGLKSREEADGLHLPTSG